ncbi:MAG: MobA/MobL family protein [Oribacterium sp.]|nr:MobA/MobL family protein [Oribacterium sp.]
MPKQKKIYILDQDGNKIRTKKGYKSKTEKTTDWDGPSKAKMWRKNLTELINETNDALKINEYWEHRSFKELDIEEPHTIHLGSKANALEKKGIHIERGDYNRKVMESSFQLRI